jgi:hypothetical protein
MKIDLTKVPIVAQEMLISRGANKQQFRFSLILDEVNILPTFHERRSIPITTQLSKFKRSWNNPTGSWFMIIGSEMDEDLCMTAATGLMWRSIVKHAENAYKHSRPYHWRLFGGNYDRLRQNDEFKSIIGGIGLLMLSNLAENSTIEKIEKCRDLIAMYPDIPKVVVVAGCNPLAFSIEKLHMNPNRVLHIGRKKQVRQI